ncbi:MAG: hypothetical protein ACI9FN_004003 [Saprospiraceae bacterium]|jgi:hypothetical protein
MRRRLQWFLVLFIIWVSGYSQEATFKNDFSSYVYSFEIAGDSLQGIGGELLIK